VRALEIIAGATALLTLLYWWNTRPRRRVAIAARKADDRDALTQEAREIYASAVAGSSVFDTETGQNPALVGVNHGNGSGDHPREDLPLAARLPRALTGAPNSPADAATVDPAVAPAAPVVTPPSEAEQTRTRPNPRPTPRRAQMRARRAADSGGAGSDG
jgi:hypothetical protein